MTFTERIERRKAIAERCKRNRIMIHDVAVAFDVGVSLVRDACEEHGVRIPPSTQQAHHRLKRDAGITQMVKAGQTLAHVGNRYTITRERVRQIAAENGVQAIPRLLGGTIATNERHKRVLDALDKNKSATIGDLMAATDLSESVVKAALTRANRQTESQKRVTIASALQMVAALQKGDLQTDIARRFGITQKTVSEIAILARKSGILHIRTRGKANA